MDKEVKKQHHTLNYNFSTWLDVNSNICPNKNENDGWEILDSYSK